MSMHVRKLQILRRTVQVLVVAFIVTIPAVARYNNYLAAYELDRVLEKWSGTVQGATLSAIDSTPVGCKGIESSHRSVRRR
jgi:hypothetical protein